MKVIAMIIDDSAIMRRMIMSTLMRLGKIEFEFVEASNGEEAIEELRSLLPDIVFCDWSMPMMNGYDFVKRVRAEPGWRALPIIIVSEEKSLGNIDDALNRAGANEYITKPFTVNDFERKAIPLLSKAVTVKRAGPDAAA